MNNTTKSATVGGLLLGTAGIGVLWASGVVFPFAVPPGMIMLTTGALLVGLTSPR
ncbi:hypothetical protein [Lentzea tibetensis]|uniref:hypothetical protein n=1 Tax=Lentzea tibetensis TaxID=2591470 RepID=UPI00164612CB|nr:hypothetical protein [Lentzea tibetensis]